MERTSWPIADERRRAIVAAYERNGGNITAAAREAAVTIRTARRWITRYRQAGLHGLQPRSHARKTMPKKRIDRDVIARVWEIHRLFPALAHQRIAALLTAKEGVAISRSSVQRILQRRDTARGPNVQPVPLPLSPISVSMERRLQEVTFLIEHVCREEADALVLAASERERAGSERWAKLLLTYCPLLRQQAGNATGAEEIIAFVAHLARTYPASVCTCGGKNAVRRRARLAQARRGAVFWAHTAGVGSP